ncbi:MAG: energy-coupled thiamine transporter ThiT [Clostridia bacterium]|nr:energy-coupled thiamine transporter ThiT [Clostridia bacterium]
MIQKTNTQKLMVCSMMIAIATVLALVCEFIPFLNLPFGGGFTVASMLPIVLASYMYGIGWGVGTAFTYSIVQMLVGFRTVSAFFLPDNENYAGSLLAAVGICFIDYVLAYTLLGFGGAFRKMKNKTAALVLGVVFALALRYVAHIISGYIFFGAWAEWFFTQEGFYAIGKTILDAFSGNALALVYSVFYNGLFMLPEIVITSIIAVPMSRIPQIKSYQK